MGYIDVDLQEKFEFYSYGHALEILYDAFPVEWGEIQKCLRELRLTVADLKNREETNRLFPKNLTMSSIPLDGEKSGSAET